MIALASKNYYIINKENDEIKLKGVSKKVNLNEHINKEAFEKCINPGEITDAEDYILRTKSQ
jgi:hypothetical protein